MEQYELFADDYKIDAKLVRSLKLGTQTEGMVADDETGTVYIGEEVAGIWKFDAEPNGATSGKLISKSSEENPNIKYDVEGLAISPDRQRKRIPGSFIAGKFFVRCFRKDRVKTNTWAVQNSPMRF